MKDIPVQCTRCRNQHMESVRIKKLKKPRKPSDAALSMSDFVCPCCGCKSYYDMRPQVAWCWASGLIEIGDKLPAEKPDGSGAIFIAKGPKAFLKSRLETLARHGKGASAGKLLVPGVPEEYDQTAKGDALAAWLKWCGARKRRDGVVWNSLKE